MCKLKAVAGRYKLRLRTCRGGLTLIEGAFGEVAGVLQRLGTLKRGLRFFEPDFLGDNRPYLSRRDQITSGCAAEPVSALDVVSGDGQ